MHSRRIFMAGMAGGLALSSRILGANDRIRLGMIGPGFRGLQLIWSMRDPNTEFVAFADVYSGRLDSQEDGQGDGQVTERRDVLGLPTNPRR